MSALSSLARARTHRSKRISSWDQSGKDRDCLHLPPGETATIARIAGAGVIRHIWITVACEDPLYPRKVILRFYWDGEERPSVECPLGDFFGVGHGVLSHFVSLPLNIIAKGGGPQLDAALNCFFPMPFAQGARLTVTNEADAPLSSFYDYVDYEEHDAPEDDLLRFHAQWRRENPTRGTFDLTRPGLRLEEVHRATNLDGKENYVILDAAGRGHYVGCNLSIDHINPVPDEHWFGDGDDMIFIDGDTWPPSLHGTGTEDYFCAAWYFPSGKYDAPYHGISYAGPTEGELRWSGKWTLYRFHIEDPIAFERRIRVTIEHGHANCLSDDYASVAYWYQTEPHQPFEPMPPVGERLPIDERESLRGFMRTISSPPESTPMRRNQHQSVGELLLDRQPKGDYWPWLSKFNGEWADKKSANKFMLGSTLNYQMRAEQAWGNAERFAEGQLGDPDDLWEAIIKISDWDSDDARQRYRLHRFPRRGHKRVRRIGKEIVERYDGDARNIWDDQAPCEVLNRLNGMQVGPETSWMIVGALLDTKQISGAGELKADIHVRRVLGRVFTGEDISADQAHRIANEMHPDNSWMLDAPLFRLGQTHCRPRKPKCADCYLRGDCNYAANARSG